MEMMSTETAREKGKKGGLNKRGKKHKTTIVREKLEIKEIDDLKETVLKNFQEFANGNDESLKLIASKELAKYIFPQKREFQGKFDGNITVNFNY
jgi:ParB-like chromosome segregation protein Spo0J